MSTRTVNDFKPEIRSFLMRLLADGWEIRWMNDGDDESTRFVHIEQAVEYLSGVDESTVSALAPGSYWMPPAPDSETGKWKTVGSCRFLLILGNSPGELVSDYSWPRDRDFAQVAADKVTDAHYEAWDGQVQPTAEVLARI